MQKCFLLSVAGPYDYEAGRTPMYPTGCIYTQQLRMFAVLAIMEKVEGIEKLVRTLDDKNKMASKAASEAIRKLELPDIHFENGKTVNYSRLGTALRVEGKVFAYRTDGDGDDEPAYIAWKMGVNEWPNIFSDPDEVDDKEWWNKRDRFVKGE